MARDRCLILTPTYDERLNLAPFIESVFSVVPEAHVLVIDDASPDGTGALADSIAARDPRVAVLHRPAKLGLGTAYLDGFRYGLERGYEWFVEMDTDLSHDARSLPAFFRELEAGADVVVGSRNVPGGRIEGWGPGRHLLSKGGSLYARIVLGAPIRDFTTGFKAFTRHALESIDLGTVRSNGYSFQIELTYRAWCRGLRVVETPIVFVDRRAGQSKLSRRVFGEAVTMVWKLRLDALAGRFGARP
jgi:dolichol-phosphate mannosyltransferase